MSGDPRGQLFAAAYQHLAAAMDRHGTAIQRRRLLEGLSGVVLEIGAGSGANFPHYPPAVTAVLAVEPHPALRDRARRAAAHAPVPVHVLAGTAEHLPIADNAADAAVFCLVLCTIADPDRALSQASRAVRPGGQLRVFEHVRSARPSTAALQDLATPAWSRLAGGCHLGRDTLATLTGSPWQDLQARQLQLRPLPGLPAVPHLHATATKR